MKETPGKISTFRLMIDTINVCMDVLKNGAGYLLCDAPFISRISLEYKKDIVWRIESNPYDIWISLTIFGLAVGSFVASPLPL